MSTESMSVFSMTSFSKTILGGAVFASVIHETVFFHTLEFNIFGAISPQDFALFSLWWTPKIVVVGLVALVVVAFFWRSSMEAKPLTEFKNNGEMNPLGEPRWLRALPWIAGAMIALSICLVLSAAFVADHFLGSSIAHLFSTVWQFTFIYQSRIPIILSGVKRFGAIAVLSLPQAAAYAAGTGYDSAAQFLNFTATTDHVSIQYNSAENGLLRHPEKGFLARTMERGVLIVYRADDRNLGLSTQSFDRAQLKFIRWDAIESLESEEKWRHKAPIGCRHIEALCLRR